MSTAARPRASGEGAAIPIVNFYITREGSGEGRTAATTEEKARLIEGVSDLLLEVLGKPKDSTFVTIQEVELENWGRSGLPVPAYRDQLKTTGGG